MKCTVCKADSMVKTKTTYFSNFEGCYVIIENVPCYRCTQCGEEVFSAGVMEKIDEILDEIHHVASKIFIMDYSQAA